ncbi:MAG: hypothetical protein ACREQP_09165, partial [Candidatus Binatia bacterium]
TVEAVHAYSGGIPRLINILCDNGMLTAYALGKQSVEVGMIEETARDLNLAVLPGRSAPADPDIIPIKLWEPPPPTPAERSSRFTDVGDVKTPADAAMEPFSTKPEPVSKPEIHSGPAFKPEIPPAAHDEEPSFIMLEPIPKPEIEPVPAPKPEIPPAAHDEEPSFIILEPISKPEIEPVPAPKPEVSPAIPASQTLGSDEEPSSVVKPEAISEPEIPPGPAPEPEVPPPQIVKPPTPKVGPSPPKPEPFFKPLDMRPFTMGPAPARKAAAAEEPMSAVSAAETFLPGGPKRAAGAHFVPPPNSTAPAVEFKIETVPPKSFSLMISALTEAMGPMASLIVREQIDAMGESLQAFPKQKLRRLVEVTSREILSERSRDDFMSLMSEEIRAMHQGKEER